MTKSEFQDLQLRVQSSGSTLKEFLKAEGVAYSTYNYWCKKMKAEATNLPIAPISIRSEASSSERPRISSEVPGVMLAFPNGVRAHFGRGSERVLMEVLMQSMSCHVLPQ